MASALIKNFFFQDGSSSGQIAVPTPANSGNSSEISSSMSRQSRGAPGRSLEWATFGKNNFEYSTPVVSARYGSAEGPYGISTAHADPLQGHTPPNGFRPNDGLSTNSFGITAEDVVSTALDFVPLAGGVKDIYKGIENGDGWQVAIGTDSIILDIFTLGGSSLAKGAILTGIKGGGRFLAKNGVKAAPKLLTHGRFPSLAKKFGKHSEEWSQWGSISKEVFYKRAVKLANSPVGGHIRGFTSTEGWTFRFNSQTGEFLTTHPSGYIETFFRPKQGLDYYLKQVQLYGN